MNAAPRTANNELRTANNELRTTSHEPRTKILLVRLRLVGDVVFTTPIIRAVRRRFPDAHLAYVVEPLAADVLRDNPHLDEVVVAPKRPGIDRWRDDLGLARRLRRARYDIAIDLHGGPRASWLTWATGAPMRIGYRIQGRTWMYTHVVARAPDLRPRHSVLNQWDLLAPLGIGDPDRARDAIEIPENPAAASVLDRRLRGLGIEPHDQVVAIHVSAGNPFRRWPPESFTELAVRLAASDSSRRLVITSGPSDAAAAARIAAAARLRLGSEASRVVDATFDVGELHALCGRAAVYIGGDSGPLHLASATSTPVVALFGPTLPERSMPWRDPRWFSEAVDAGPLPCRPCHQRTCEPGDFRCLTRITVEQVLAASERALATKRA